jgi:hypothetical protein
VKFVLVFNKRDLFHDKLKDIPLHTCPHFENVRPKGVAESHADYCRRCEEAVAEYFASVERQADKICSSKDGIGHLVGMKNYHFSCATDLESFAKLTHELCTLFKEEGE